MDKPAGKDIVLTTLNARYAHSSLALRYLYANLHELREQSCIAEFVIQDQANDIVERLLQYQPRIIGLGMYIWNAQPTATVITLLKQLAPDVCLVLGGPEVSHAPIRVDVTAADHIICGEGELAFYHLCQDVLHERNSAARFIKGEVTPLATLCSPYPWYSDSDIRHRSLYVEASRGCPFRCEFCLSSLDRHVRNDELGRFLAELELLWQRGARNFRFIDRTFNLNMRIAEALLDFFLAKGDVPYFVHFEVIPDHFPHGLRERLGRFPAGSLQLEIGIQTLNPEVAARIQRKMNMQAMTDNLSFLETATRAHMHLDLIVGLPGESQQSFARGLDTLCAMSKAEIQVGILKKLSGTALARHDEDFAMVYETAPPYALLQNLNYSFQQMQEMKRFARFWDLYYNSGNFRRCLPMLWPDGRVFDAFFVFSLWLFEQTQSTWKISLERLAKYLYEYLLSQSLAEADTLRQCMLDDLLCMPGRKIPTFLRQPQEQLKTTKETTVNTRNRRQQRHA